MMENKQPKVLIIGTQPYNKMVQSRAFDSYFKQFDQSNLAQIFSDARKPCKGHCSKLFQITDIRLIKKRFKNIDTGIIFKREDLDDEWTEKGAAQKYKPKRKGPFFHLIRKFVWKKKYWFSETLDKFVNNFNPDIVFISFSKDFFIIEIGLYFAQKYNIPIVVSIADDYIFHDSYKGNFFNFIYRKQYLKLVEKLMRYDTTCIFESEAIKRKYLSYYDVPGEVIYIGSSIEPSPCHFIDDANILYYFGNLEYGRLDSIIAIANTLLVIDKNIRIEVYSANFEAYRKTNLPCNMKLCNQIAYGSVVEKMKHAKALIVVEGFKKNDVECVRYSLSTKVGDSLCSGIPVLAYGHKDTGAISFLRDHECAFIATNKNELITQCDILINSKEEGNYIFKKQFNVAKTCFSLEQQSKKALQLFKKVSMKGNQ